MRKIFLDQLTVEYVGITRTGSTLGNCFRLYKDGEFIAVFPSRAAAELFIEVFSSALPHTCPISTKWRIEKAFVADIGF